MFSGDSYKYRDILEFKKRTIRIFISENEANYLLYKESFNTLIRKMKVQRRF